MCALGRNDWRGHGWCSATEALSPAPGFSFPSPIESCGLYDPLWVPGTTRSICSGSQAYVLVSFLLLRENTRTQNNLGRKGFIAFTLPGHSAPLRKVKTRTQVRSLKAGPLALPPSREFTPAQGSATETIQEGCSLSHL